jgi:hypothetical protein
MSLHRLASGRMQSSSPSYSSSASSAAKAHLYHTQANTGSQASTIIDALEASLIATLTTHPTPINVVRIERLAAYYDNQLRALQILEPEHLKILGLIREAGGAAESPHGSSDPSSPSEKAQRATKKREDRHKQVYQAELARLGRRKELLEGAWAMADGHHTHMFRLRMEMVIKILTNAP